MFVVHIVRVCRKEKVGVYIYIYINRSEKIYSKEPRKNFNKNNSYDGLIIFTRSSGPYKLICNCQGNGQPSFKSMSI